MKKYANQPYSLLAAAALGDARHVKELIAMGADVNETDRDRRTPLFAAIENRHENVVHALLSARPAPNVNCRCVEDNTPLMLSVTMQAPQLVRYLVSDMIASSCR
jgi:ankyrin repeat protein